jgi:hypothetical protein
LGSLGFADMPRKGEWGREEWHNWYSVLMRNAFLRYTGGPIFKYTNKPFGSNETSIFETTYQI